MRRLILAVIVSALATGWFTKSPSRLPSVGPVLVEKTTLGELTEWYGPGLKNEDWPIYAWRDAGRGMALRVVLNTQSEVCHLEYGMLEGAEDAPRANLDSQLPAGLQFGDDLETVRRRLGETGYEVGRRPGIVTYNFTECWDVPRTYGQFRFVDGKLSRVYFRVD